MVNRLSLPINGPCLEISLADTSKLLATDLVRAFPDTLFKRKIERWRGGNQISLRWIDGPAEERVGNVARHYHGRAFDKQQGCYLARIVDEPYGRGPTHYECNSVELHRGFSVKALEQVREAYCRCTYDPRPDIIVDPFTGGAHYAETYANGESIHAILMQEARRFSANDLPTLAYKIDTIHRNEGVERRLQRTYLTRHRDWSGGVYPDLAVISERYYYYGPALHHYIVPVVKRLGPHTVIVSDDWLWRIYGYASAGCFVSLEGRKRMINHLPTAYEDYQEWATARPALLAQIRAQERQKRENAINVRYLHA